MHLMILKENERLHIDNDKLNLLDFAEKLEEEFNETIEAINTGKTKEDIAGEVLDTIQICSEILDKLTSDGLELEKTFDNHNKKLIRRGWKTKYFIEISK